MKIHCFIPARMGSSRFPGKPLFKINNKAMIEWVFLASKKSQCHEVYITTPDEEIISFCNEKNFPVLKTSPKHERCLDRVYEAYQGIKDKNDKDIVVCMQGDEPLVVPEMINTIVKFHKKRSSDFVVSALRITKEEFNNPNIVKIAHDDNFKTIYTSRAPIPYTKNFNQDSIRISGLFTLSPKGLETFYELPPSRLEILESCDTNRILGTSLSQYVCIHNNVPIQQSVDIYADAIKADKILKEI